MAHAAMAPTLPTEADAALAKETSRVLAFHIRNSDPLELRVPCVPSPEGNIRLPVSAARLLLRILEEMARGNAVALIPVHAELTTQEAAEMLNISRPSLIRLLEEGKIDHRRIGTHRRVPFESLMKYKRRTEAARKAALAELAAYDQEIGL